MATASPMNHIFFICCCVLKALAVELSASVWVCFMNTSQDCSIETTNLPACMNHGLTKNSVIITPQEMKDWIFTVERCSEEQKLSACIQHWTSACRRRAVSARASLCVSTLGWLIPTKHSTLLTPTQVHELASAWRFAFPAMPLHSAPQAKWTLGEKISPF